ETGRTAEEEAGRLGDKELSLTVVSLSPCLLVSLSSSRLVAQLIPSLTGSADTCAILRPATVTASTSGRKRAPPQTVQVRGVMNWSISVRSASSVASSSRRRRLGITPSNGP